ncbi:MAG: hypothetical protein LLG04_11635 [Parachlamydia sp.]|nr:hypothetical protein [Parachlamydia sp.]
MNPEELRKTPTLLKAVEQFLQKYPQAGSTMRLGENLNTHQLLLAAKSKTIHEALGDVTEAGPFIEMDPEIQQEVKDFFDGRTPSITPKNVFKLFYFAQRTETGALEEACIAYILKNVLHNLLNEPDGMEHLSNLIVMHNRFLLPVVQLRERFLPLDHMPPSVKQVGQILTLFPNLVYYDAETENAAFRVTSSEKFASLKDLPRLKHITHLAILANPVRLGEPGPSQLCQQVAQHLQEFPNIRSLSLGLHGITREDAQALSRTLVQLARGERVFKGFPQLLVAHLVAKFIEKPGKILSALSANQFCNIISASVLFQLLSQTHQFRFHLVFVLIEIGDDPHRRKMTRLCGAVRGSVFDSIPQPRQHPWLLFNRACF